MKNIFLTLFLFLSINSFANDSIFEIANQLYEKQEYQEAQITFFSILENNLHSSELYFNLGNCHYRLDQYAEAIWYYEKSLKIDPGFSDANENIKIVKLKIVDKIEILPKLLHQRWWHNQLNATSLFRWKQLTIVLLLISLLLLVLSNFFKIKTKKLSATLLGFSLICLFITFSINNDILNRNHAIIFSSSTNAMSAPSESSLNLFTLHSGTKVLILDKINNWSNIKTSNGKKGWILSEGIKNI